MLRGIIIAFCLYVLWPVGEGLYWLANASDWERTKEFSLYYISTGKTYEDLLKDVGITVLMVGGLALYCFAGWRVNGRTLLDELNGTPAKPPVPTPEKPAAPDTLIVVQKGPGFARQKPGQFGRRQD